jgi:hypothetical protein
VKLCENLSHFPDAGSTSIIRPHGDVQAIKVTFTREFWFASSKEFAKKIARAKLDKVGFWKMLLVFWHLTNISILIFINSFFFWCFFS